MPSVFRLQTNREGERKIADMVNGREKILIFRENFPQES
jgi:hypothetical protein